MRAMKAIDIDGELRSLVATEEMLAHFDFVLPLPSGEVEGLCKVSRPRERNSRSTYLSLFFIIDAHEEAARKAIDAHLSRADWAGCGESTPGVDCVLAIPHRNAKAGLFLKEIDVYLDGSQAPSAAFVRDALQPAIARATGLRPGELSIWEDSATPDGGARPAAAGAQADGLFGRLRRLVSGNS